MANTHQERRSGLSPLVWIAVAALVLFVSFPTLVRLSMAWPPAFLERRTQRGQVLERVKAAGGWAALQRDCTTLIDQHRDTDFYWVFTHTNALPTAIAALKPREVRLNGGEPWIVHIKVFGFRSTDGHQPQYFGLQVVSGNGADSYKPKDMRCEFVTNYIYEVYY